MAGRRTHHFDFDGISAVGRHEHAQPVVERLVARAKVREHERDVDRLAAALERKVVRREGACAAVAHAVRAARGVRLQQAVGARRRGWGILPTSMHEFAS